ncbi:MAG: AI-2E family transporter [Sphingobium sp.]
MNPSKQQDDIFFLILLIAVTVAFALIAAPFFAPILWGVVAAVLFAPVNSRLQESLPARPNLAALITLLLIIAIVIIPTLLLGQALVNEATTLYQNIRSGKIDFPHMFAQIQQHLPGWLRSILRRYGLFDPNMMRARLTESLGTSAQTAAAQIYAIGQSAFGFVIMLGVMLYLTFFLLRDGSRISARIERAVPLPPHMWRALVEKFVTVIRATIKGSVIVAIIQGMFGGILFSLLGITGALLWGVLMGICSLLPAIGTGLVWVPVAIYLLAVGAYGKAVILILCAMFVIGMVDNILRPILVGRDVKMPDYVVLISTLGGLEVFGFGGIVIGPVIAALFIAVWDIFALSQTKEQKADPA